MSEVNQDTGKPDNTGRWIMAFFVSPLVPGLLEQCLVAIYERPGPSDVGFGIVFAFTASMIAGYPIYLVFGLPTIWLCQKFGFDRLKEFILAGAVAGSLSITIIHFAFSDGTTATLRNQILAFVSFAVAGGVSASVTWLIVRPDRQANSPLPPNL